MRLNSVLGSMKKLASQIERELQTGGWNHCAIYEHDLIRVWPLDEPQREAKIAKFANQYGFRLRFYRIGMCAIFDKSPQGKVCNAFPAKLGALLPDPQNSEKY
jgi:hypothetical protein